MRYDAQEHLDEFRRHGGFPRIHEGVATMFATEREGRRVLDLGCSTGLLGQRLLRLGAELVIGVDVDEDAIQAGRQAGLDVHFNHLKVERATFSMLAGVIQQNSLDVVIARRILPELFGNDLEAGRTFAQLLAHCGIKELIVEGRVVSPSATNPLQSIDAEVKMLGDSWRESRRAGAVSYLVPR